MILPTRQLRERARIIVDTRSNMDTDFAIELALLERLRSAAELLERLAADRRLLNQLPAEGRERLLRAAAELYNPDKLARREMMKAAERERTKRADTVLDETGIRTLRRKPVFTTPNVFPPPNPEQTAELPESQHCYICKQHFSVVHHFYDQMCPACAEFNFNKRTELANLHGRVALLTGGRVKIGYQAGLKLLRAGARLIVTTRFPEIPLCAMLRNRISPTGRIAWKSSDWTCAIPRVLRRYARTCWRPFPGWISSSIMPARRCAARPSSTST